MSPGSASRISRTPRRTSAWAGLRGAVPIVLATIPITAGLPAAERIFDVVFLLVVVFTLVQGPTLPLVARRLGVTEPDGTRDVVVESAPLDEIDASVISFTVPAGSRMAGVYVSELRLPGGSMVTLVVRDGETFVPEPATGPDAGPDTGSTQVTGAATGTRCL
ncbi:MAG TPA: cation:proton antiporter [Nocardioidaceae bacterium]|nr:cation:proton antiporter [Nocardioidaceae bacterium]